jgi:thiol reductant ABC exporter CydD subunit
VLTTRAWRRTAVSIACGTLAGALAVLFFILLGRAVDAVVVGGRTLADLRLLLAGLAGVAVARGLASWLGDVCAWSAAGDVKTSIRDRFVAALARRGPRAAGAERTGEIANTLVGGVEAVEAYVGQYVPQAVLAMILPPIVLAVVVALDPLSGLVLAVTGPLIPLFMWLIGGTARTRTRQQFVTLSRLSARFLDAVQALPMLKAFGRADEEAAAIARASERFRAVTLAVLRVAFVSALTLELLAAIGVAIVAVEVGLRLLYARLSFLNAFTVLLLAPEFYRPLRNLGAAFHAGMAGQEAAARVREFDAPEPLRVEPAGGVPEPEAAPASGMPPPGIVFRGVSFSYVDGSPPAVADIRMEIAPGRTLALVGPSGSGKSTIARLLLRFLEPGEGDILADGSPLGRWDPDLWRRRVAWVPQHPHLFHGTILENLRLARPDAPDDAIARALAEAHADEFVRGLPMGLATPVGERGQRLSGGQAQRIALARAFLKDAPLLILDEPTAQLDPENEDAVRESMTSLRRGRTVLLIAHRLTTVADADAIAVISGGRLVEFGAHEDLAARGGRYAAMLAAYGGAR